MKWLLSMIQKPAKAKTFALAGFLFLRTTGQAAMLAWIFGDCREGQISRCSAALRI